MLLSGRFIDRLIIKILPITACVSILLYFSKTKSFESLFAAFVLITLFFCIVDFGVMFYIKPKRLRANGALILGSKKIEAADICSIKPTTYKLGRLGWNFIQITFKQSHAFETMNVMEKSTTYIGLIKGKDSKTLSALLKKYPELEEKVTGKYEMHSFR